MYYRVGQGEMFILHHLCHIPYPPNTEWVLTHKEELRVVGQWLAPVEAQYSYGNFFWNC